MSYFKEQSVIEDEMIADFKEITGVQLVKTDLSREEIIKIKQEAIAFSHAYAAMDRIADDFFPGSASKQALIKHLAARQMPPQSLKQPSVGTIKLTGVIGTPVPTGNRVRQVSSGKLFFQNGPGVIDAFGNLETMYTSVLSGQTQNVDVLLDAFQMVSPIPGVNNPCTNTARFLDGRDDETPEEMLARIEEHDQLPNTGGNLIAYETFAKAASPSVVTAHAIKNPRGQGTVDTVITSGTTDIRTAVTNGDPVDRVPSGPLIATVQAYILAHNPVTDDHLTIAPIEDSFNSTFLYDLYDESLRAQVDAIVTREWKIFVYSAVSGKAVDPTALERLIDAQVGALIVRRRVNDFGGGGEAEYLVPEGHILTPGVLTLGPAP